MNTHPPPRSLRGVEEPFPAPAPKASQPGPELPCEGLGGTGSTPSCQARRGSRQPWSPTPGWSEHWVGWMAHEAGAAQHSSGLDLAPWSMWSASSRYSWKATTALAVVAPQPRSHCGRGGVGKQSHHQTCPAGAPTAPGMSILQGAAIPSSRSPRSCCPPASRSHAGCSAQPSPCNPPSQPASRFPGSPRESQQGGISQPKKYSGERKTEDRNHKKNPTQPFPWR